MKINFLASLKDQNARTHWEALPFSQRSCNSVFSTVLSTHLCTYRCKYIDEYKCPFFDTCKHLTLRYSVQNVGSKYQAIPKNATFCCCSVVQLCPTCKELECSTDTALQASLSLTVSLSLLKLMPIDWLMLSNHFTLCHPLLFLPSIFPSISVSSIESDLHIRWSKYWSFSFSISPSNEYSGLISFSIDWFDLITVQGTLKSLLQHHV